MCQTSSQQVVTDYQQNDSNLHPPKAQGMRSYSIEDALSKTSECFFKMTSFWRFIAFKWLIWFLHRFRLIQLLSDIHYEHDNVRCVHGVMRCSLHFSCITMRSQVNHQRKRIARRCGIFWYDLFVAFMGISGRYTRTSSSYHSNAFNCVCPIRDVIR